MKTLQITLLALWALLFYNAELLAQKCSEWSVPVAFTDSVSDNRNAFIAKIPDGTDNYSVFWERNSVENGSEIVYRNFYNTGDVTQLVSGNGFTLSNPQVISMSDWNPDTDTLAFVFYETDHAGDKDIYYKIISGTGLSDPILFAGSDLDETHLRVNQSGGMTWQEGDKIKYTMLRHVENDFFFDPVVVVDSGNCFSPDLASGFYYNPGEYIAWEKGTPGNASVWYCQWGWDSGQWGLPMELFPAGTHSGLSFSKTLSYFGAWSPLLISDYQVGNGELAVSVYDMYNYLEMVTTFTQGNTFQPDLFTFEILTDDIPQAGFLTFSRELEGDNSDILSTDYGQISENESSYCQVGISGQPDVNPGLFEGYWGISYFDLICIWESWRNGHWQLFSSVNKVLIGGIADNKDNSGFSIKATPNPFTNDLRFECESLQPATVNISLINTCGAVVKEIKNQWIMKGPNTLSINTNGLPHGIYLLRLESEGDVTSLKVLKR